MWGFCSREYAYGAGASLPGTITTPPPTTSRTQDTETDGASAVSLWVDALGQVAGIRSGSAGSATSGSDATDQCFLSWDVAAAVPSIARIGQVPVSLATGVSTVPTGVRGVDPFALSPVADLQGAGSGVVLAGVGVTAAGSLALGGLEVLGARVYDPVARGFMSVDPLASPVGAGWASNVYAFVGNDPVGLVDPWGLSPMTASEFREYRADTRGRAGERIVSGMKSMASSAVDWVKDNWVGIAMVAGGIAATALLGPLGAAIVGGALISGGISAMTNKNADGSINWAAVGKDFLFGAVSGGAAYKVMGWAGKALAPKFSKVADAARSRASGFLNKSTAHANKADNLGFLRIPGSKTYHNWRAGVNEAKYAKFDAKATLWGNRADVAGDAARFGETWLGKGVNGSAAGGVSNGLTYTMPETGSYSVREDWSVGGMAVATGGGSLMGGLKPVVPKSGNAVVNYGVDRVKDYVVGAGNAMVLTAPSDWKLEELHNAGMKATGKGMATGLGKSGRRALSSDE